MTGPPTLRARPDDGPGPAESELLDRRAAALAVVPPVRTQRRSVLTFAVGAERVGVDLGWVRCVLARRDPAVVPGAPQAFLGVVDVRSEPVVVVDLRHLLALAGRSATVAVVVLQGPGAPLGVAAEDLPRVESLPASALEAAPPDPADVGVLVAGDSGPLTLLAVPALLTDPRCIAGAQ